jgi:cell division initiation protein
MLNSDTSATAAPPVTETEARRPSLADRNLSVSPIDMRQARFGSAMRGFDRAEVTSFLLEASEAYEQALRDNDRLRQEVARLDAALTQHRELENSLKTTLMSAQRVADDMRDNATQEATRIVREAEGRAELLINRAHARAEDVQREIDGLRLKRREAEASIESTISALHHTLEFVREQDSRERRVQVAG